MVCKSQGTRSFVIRVLETMAPGNEDQGEATVGEPLMEAG